jgi:hypothetical protein
LAEETPIKVDDRLRGDEGSALRAMSGTISPSYVRVSGYPFPFLRRAQEHVCPAAASDDVRDGSAVPPPMSTNAAASTHPTRTWM